MWRNLQLSLSIIVFLGASMAVEAQTNPCSSPKAAQFDFWLGEWELSWPAEQSGGVTGQTGRGTNRIEKIMGDCTVQENFSFADGSYQGKSWSVYNPRSGVWQQTWVDNGGAYLLFKGGFENEQVELRTEPREQDGKTLVNRMVFSNISETGFNWDWQRSEDGGESWSDLWNIIYTRKD